MEARTMAIRRVTVSTRQYEASHGHKPRGRGLWAFKIGERTGFITGTYTEAKNEAIKQAKRENLFTQIEVLP
jgi:hypothetical protein